MRNFLQGGNRNHVIPAKGLVEKVEFSHSESAVGGAVGEQRSYLSLP